MGEKKWVLPVRQKEGKPYHFCPPGPYTGTDPNLPEFLCYLANCEHVNKVCFYLRFVAHFSVTVPKICVRIYRSLASVTHFLSLEIKKFLLIFDLLFSGKVCTSFQTAKSQIRRNVNVYLIQSLTTRLQSRWKTLIFSSPMYNNTSKNIWTIITQC